MLDGCTMIDAADLRTFKQIAEEMPVFSYHRLRYLYANRQTNGTAEAGVWAWIGNEKAVVKSALNRWVNQKQPGRTN